MGACSPRKFLEIRSSEIASEAILGQKHSHTRYLARGVLHLITKPADFEFSREKVLRLAEQQVYGETSLEGQLSTA